MNPQNQETFLTRLNKKNIVIIIFILIISLFFIFKNEIFKSSIILKNLGNESIDPEMALINKKPTFIEFYAEWCEVCKKMAPDIFSLKDEFEKDINFVFLNVDNPKWEKYISKYKVSGIPQINILDSEGNLRDTFIGLQDEQIIKNVIKKLDEKNYDNNSFIGTDYSQIKENTDYNLSPRSHY